MFRVNALFTIFVLASSLTYGSGGEYEVVLTHKDQRHDFLQDILQAVETGEKIGGYRIKKCGWEPALFIDTYYDTADFAIYQNDSALRARSRFKTLSEEVLRDAFLEAKISKKGASEGTFLNEEFQGEKFVSLEGFHEYLSTSIQKDHTTQKMLASINKVNSEVQPMVEAKNKRTFLCAYKRSPLLSFFIPKFALTLDDITIENQLDPNQVFKYFEMEIQIFTQIPLITGITKGRIKRANAFAEKFKSRFNLTKSDFSKYKKAVEYFKLR